MPREEITLNEAIYLVLEIAEIHRKRSRNIKGSILTTPRVNEAINKLHAFLPHDYQPPERWA